MSGAVNIGGVWKDILQPSANVGGVWKDGEEGWLNIGGIWHKWWPASELPGCPPAGNYEPLRVGGGGFSGATFAMDTYAGCGITAAAAKVGFGWNDLQIPQTMNVNGNPSGTFYRTISVDDNVSERTIFYDMGATAAAQFESGAAIGYSLSNSSLFVQTTRLRVTI